MRSAGALRCGGESRVHPDAERLPGLVGGGLHGASFCFGDAHAEDHGAGVVERRASSAFRLTHAPENIRPRKVLTRAGFVGHNKGMTTSRTAEDTARYRARTKAAIARAEARKPAAKLTPAPRRDLARLQAGESIQSVRIAYCPFKQLLDAGYIVGTQHDYRLVAR
jgi:hypothetical protein